jgi:hypothetical protein
MNFYINEISGQLVVLVKFDFWTRVRTSNLRFFISNWPRDEEIKFTEVGIIPLIILTVKIKLKIEICSNVEQKSMPFAAAYFQ